MTTELDLIALVPDADTEWTIRTLLEKRCQSLQIKPVQFKIIRDSMRDNGVFYNAPILLRPYIKQTQHALIIFDYEGSGQEHQKSVQEIETDVEERLQKAGWDVAQICVIVLNPELEIWVWSSSPHVAQVLGVSFEELQNFKEGLPLAPNGKPQHPKEAMQVVLRRSKQPFSARIFQELAERVSLNTSERAFDKLRAVLQQWFPPETP